MRISYNIDDTDINVQNSITRVRIFRVLTLKTITNHYYYILKSKILHIVEVT